MKTVYIFQPPASGSVVQRSLTLYTRGTAANMSCDTEWNICNIMREQRTRQSECHVVESEVMMAVVVSISGGEILFATCFMLVSCLEYSSTLKTEAIIPPKLWLNLNRLQGIICQTIELFICEVPRLNQVPGHDDVWRGGGVDYES
jgi:hypothetical protein